MLKAGRTAMGARAAGSHTGALAGDDKVYDDILRQAGVVRAPGLNDMLEYARALPVLPTPKGENVVIITGAGGSGVLLSDACVDNGLSAHGDPAGPRRGLPRTSSRPSARPATRSTSPAASRPAPTRTRSGSAWTTRASTRWSSATGTRSSPRRWSSPNWSRAWWPRSGRKGIDKPVVASLAGDTEVEEACEYLFEHGVLAYPYTTEKPVAVLGAKYRWARAAGLLRG